MKEFRHNRCKILGDICEMQQMQQASFCTCCLSALQLITARVLLRFIETLRTNANTYLCQNSPINCIYYVRFKLWTSSYSTKVIVPVCHKARLLLQGSPVLLHQVPSHDWQLFLQDEGKSASVSLKVLVGVHFDICRWWRRNLFQNVKVFQNSFFPTLIKHETTSRLSCHAGDVS